jgi:HEPN domain-containing protein
MIELFEGLLFRADNDLQVVVDLFQMNHQSLDVMIYHTQQCAEKALKAFLAFHKQEYPKTHDLGVLVNLCAEINSEFYELLDMAVTLIPSAIEFRYVNTLEEADTLTDLLPSKDEVKIAIKYAATILDFVKQKIGESIPGECGRE